MRIGFYLDIADPQREACAARAIAAVRETNAGAWVVHATCHGGPDLDADERIEHPAGGPYGLRRTRAFMGAGPVLQLGADVLVRSSLADLWERAQAYDVAVATDMLPGHPGVRYNGCVLFTRGDAFLAGWQRRIEHMDFGQAPGDWLPIEAAFTAEIEQGGHRVLVLPGEEFNYVPSAPGDTGGARIVHYRGDRKRWMVEG